MTARQAPHNAAMPAPPLYLPPTSPPLLRSWRRRLLIQGLIAVSLAIGVSGFITLTMGGGYQRNLVFSLCIGGVIQAMVELGRHGLSACRKRLGHRSPQLDAAWPGWALMAPWVVVSALAGQALGHWLGSMITGSPVSLLVGYDNRGMTLVLLLTLALPVLVTYYFWARTQLAHAAARAEAAQRLASENQLRLLQSQLEPHMLFNTLANLRVLIGLDTERAQEMLDRLIAFLRATLAASRSVSHPLSAEFDRVADYLALMAVRMGPRLTVSLDLPDTLRACLVPPLLLQPLVENSIKHGLEPKVEGGRIAVSARRDGDQLVLEVRDTGVGLSGAAGAACTDPAAQGSADGGFGTHQIRARLQALYGSAARFELLRADDGDGGTLARISLPALATPNTDASATTTEAGPR